jgi:hypothetical protein
MQDHLSKWRPRLQAIPLLVLFVAGTMCVGCEATPDTCAEQFIASEVPSNVEAADDYVSGVQRVTDGGLFLVELVRSTPPPKFTGDYTWEVTVQDTACVSLGSVHVKAEPTMPQHGHGTTPEFTEASLDTSKTFTLTDMDLFMPGVWQVEITVTADDGAVDTVSWFFDLQG